MVGEDLGGTKVLPSPVTKRRVAWQVALVGILVLSTCRYGPAAAAQSGDDWEGALQTDTPSTAQQNPYHVTGELSEPSACKKGYNKWGDWVREALCHGAYAAYHD
jgi:hypothetical protein